MSSYRAKNICCRWWCTVRWSSHRCGAPSSSSWATSSSPSPQLSTLSSTHTRSGSIYTIQYTVQQPPTCVWQLLRVYWMPCRSPPPQSFLFKVFTFMVLRRSRKHPLKPWRIGCQNMVTRRQEPFVDQPILFIYPSNVSHQQAERLNMSNTVVLMCVHSSYSWFSQKFKASCSEYSRKDWFWGRN